MFKTQSKPRVGPAGPQEELPFLALRCSSHLTTPPTCWALRPLLRGLPVPLPLSTAVQCPAQLTFTVLSAAVAVDSSLVTVGCAAGRPPLAILQVTANALTLQQQSHWSERGWAPAHLPAMATRVHPVH